MFAFLETGLHAVTIKMFPYITIFLNVIFVLVRTLILAATQSQVCPLSSVSFLQRSGCIRLVIDPIAARVVAEVEETQVAVTQAAIG
jgi:hypothetical protein